jgi:hypothetical protein
VHAKSGSEKQEIVSISAEAAIRGYVSDALGDGTQQNENV